MTMPTSSEASPKEVPSKLDTHEEMVEVGAEESLLALDMEVLKPLSAEQSTNKSAILLMNKNVTQSRSSSVELCRKMSAAL